MYDCYVSDLRKKQNAEIERIKGGERNGRTRPDETRVTNIRKSISGSEGFTLTLLTRKRESKN